MWLEGRITATFWILHIFQSWLKNIKQQQYKISTPLFVKYNTQYEWWRLLKTQSVEHVHNLEHSLLPDSYKFVQMFIWASSR